jgi:hypothetical protein
VVDICIGNRHCAFESAHDSRLNRFGNLTAHAVNQFRFELLEWHSIVPITATLLFNPTSNESRKIFILVQRFG